MTIAEPISWVPFECDGRSFEYAAVPAKEKTRPAGWPSHEASPGPWIAITTVIVRKAGDETGPAMAFPGDTVITTAHAIEAAKKFWELLAS